MQAARRRFSENRLKDIGDEYAENYPHLGYVLNLFYGLGRRYSLNGLTAFIAKLVVDPEVSSLCAWVLMNSSPEKFADILYRIGFLGYVRDGNAHFRGVGSSGSQIPPVTSSTIMEVHPTFAEALALQDILIDQLDDKVELAHTSVITEIPEGISTEDYVERLDTLSKKIKTVECGTESAADWEDVVGETIRLCFFPWLGSLEAKSRTVDNRVIRDWVASNLASGGFWEAMRQRYNALNVIWECKNYEKLSASDFQQANYYVSELSGLVIVVFRGPRDEKKHYLEHIRRISSKANGNAIVLLANDQDLQTFVRQCHKGQFLDTHVRAIYDETIRAIS
ncbi:hypothetical protein RBSWK_02759 [Rhodopirellula baltica SWK14]|uniref:Restriction endonuclease type IV Mrr domain-containing protein n=2 Tax=Rhodopirellula baltica TaxID=265606 RepID=L7CI00_RHOBT|nr:hypothetical protein RBSWK_02759 [Rhodopirellula baltica SWK14]